MIIEFSGVSSLFVGFCFLPFYTDMISWKLQWVPHLAKTSWSVTFDAHQSISDPLGPPKITTPWGDAGLERKHLPSADAPGITKRNQMFSGAEQGADAGEDRRVREELGVSHKFCVTQILLGKLKTSSLRTQISGQKSFLPLPTWGGFWVFSSLMCSLMVMGRAHLKHWLEKLGRQNLFTLGFTA